MKIESRMKIDGNAIKLELNQWPRVTINLAWLLNSEYAAEAARLGPIALSALAPYTTPAHVAELAATELWQYRCLTLGADPEVVNAYMAEVKGSQDLGPDGRQLAYQLALDALKRGKGMPASVTQAWAWHMLKLLGES